ncbi:unnamed protein product [Arctia plantaginis]|uniref:Uncharacterized protein n=1 Tax=Arctia plantaginis TaxID=874455 RepID=A0A8S1ARS7_ARCPL|nr:unnamed protein product [Arctia plantaginis]CAB3252844.1 unnamed protein product [Arctia plantaginis]
MFLCLRHLRQNQLLILKPPGDMRRAFESFGRPVARPAEEPVAGAKESAPSNDQLFPLLRAAVCNYCDLNY